MPLTEDQAAELAFEVNEAIPAAIIFAKLPTKDKALVVRYFLDGLIGTDETAVMETIPGLTPEMTEIATDVVITLVANVLAKYIDKEPEVEEDV